MEVNVFVEFVVYRTNGTVERKSNHGYVGLLQPAGTKFYTLSFAPQQLLEISADKSIRVETYVYFHNMFDEEQPRVGACNVIADGKLQDCK